MIYLYNRFDKDNDNKISLNEFLSELTNNNNNWKYTINYNWNSYKVWFK